MDRYLRTTVLAFALSLTPASPSQAATLNLSDVSSDATPAGDLLGTITFDVLVGNVLSLTLENQTVAPDTFNINGVWWNGNAGVTSLSLTSATHSTNGDVFAAWNSIESGTSADGFGAFDFALTDGVGAANPNIIQPGQSIVFLMAITGSCTATSCSTSNFILENAQGYLAASKFVNGPDDPESPGFEDSAFGAIIPEPSTGLLLATGLSLLAGGRRRREA